MTTPTKTRRLNAADAAAYREIRLEALQSRPDAFGAAYESERDRPLEAFADTLARDAVFAAGDGGELLGMAGFLRLEGKESHKGLLWGMYVRDTARQRRRRRAGRRRDRPCARTGRKPAPGGRRPQ